MQTQHPVRLIGSANDGDNAAVLYVDEPFASPRGWYEDQKTWEDARKQDGDLARLHRPRWEQTGPTLSRNYFYATEICQHSITFNASPASDVSL